MTRTRTFALVPGVAAAALLAWASIGLRTLPQLNSISPLMIAIVFGMLVRNSAGIPAVWEPGIRFALRRILRLAVVLLGFQLSVRQIVQVGSTGLFIVALTLVAAFLFTTWLGRRLSVEPKLAALIAAGTSICGASAVVATNSVTEASDEDVAYAIAVVTVFGSLSMLLYPMAGALLHMPPRPYGLWTGASIHEIAQVLAAAFQGGAISVQFGAVCKLSRVLLLAPVIFALGWAARRRKAQSAGAVKGIPVPLFVLGFAAAICVNSLAVIPSAQTQWIVKFDQFLLALSLGAMGLETSLNKVRAAGLRPLLLGSGAWLFISVFSFLLIRRLMW
jgi:uncharacterized integral membrane protein (TIGR00698 family)